MRRIHDHDTRANRKRMLKIKKQQLKNVKIKNVNNKNVKIKNVKNKNVTNKNKNVKIKNVKNPKKHKKGMYIHVGIKMLLTCCHYI